MSDQCESPTDAVRARIAARRATLQPAAPDEALPAAVCDGWGLVPVLGLDGEYEPAACLGCVQCHVGEPVPGKAMARMVRDLPDDLGNPDGAW
jgi:hypothetical protein